MTNLLLCFYLLFLSAFHIGDVAEYYYVWDGKVLSMKFIIDKEQLDQFVFEDACAMKSMTALKVANYIKENSSIAINQKEIALELESSIIENGHLVIVMSSELEIPSIYKIEIINNCFYTFNPKFKNRVICNIAQFQNSYALYQNRRSLVVER